MSSKLEPVIWSRDTGHIGILGGVDGRMVTKAYNFLADGLPYFLTHGGPCALAFGVQSSAIKFLTGNRAVTNFSNRWVHGKSSGELGFPDIYYQPFPLSVNLNSATLKAKK